MRNLYAFAFFRRLVAINVQLSRLGVERLDRLTTSAAARPARFPRGLDLTAKRSRPGGLTYDWSSTNFISVVVPKLLSLSG